MRLQITTRILKMCELIDSGQIIKFSSQKTVGGFWQNSSLLSIFFETCCSIFNVLITTYFEEDSEPLREKLSRPLLDSNSNSSSQLLLTALLNCIHLYSNGVMPNTSQRLPWEMFQIKILISIQLFKFEICCFWSRPRLYNIQM